MSDRYVWEKWTAKFTPSAKSAVTSVFLGGDPSYPTMCSAITWYADENGTVYPKAAGNTRVLTPGNAASPADYPYAVVDGLQYAYSCTNTSLIWTVTTTSGYYLRAVEEFGSLNGSTFYRQLVPVSGVSGGTKQSTLSSADPDKYLKDKAVGTYFYDYLGSDNVDPNSVTYSTSAPVQGQSITIQVSPRSNTYGGTISYQYQYSTNNGSTWTNIDSATTSTSKSFTIPSSATQFKARVRASDNMGFTSTDYVTGENLTVKEPTATYTISLTASSGGSVSGGGTYEEGTSVTVKATASSGYRFSRWTEGGATVSSNASYTFTVTQNRTLTAVFSKILPSYRITVTASPANGGTVSGGGSYESGRSATVRATPAADFLFVEWQEDGVAVSANPTYTFTVSKARTLTAVFKRKLSAYVGIEGKARKATNLYVGVDGKARKVVRAYIGVDGKAQKFL